MTEPDVSSLMSVPEAIRLLDSVPVNPKVIRLPLEKADGLRLSRSLSTDRDYPPFDKSQMDGYAIRRADLGRIPLELRVVGEILAGQICERELNSGETMAIMTGAPLPPGADGVVPVEDVQKLSDDSIQIVRGGDPARHIARRGSDCQGGKVVLSVGQMLGPAQVAVAASIGTAEVEVFAAPNVAVLATGDELVPVDRQPGPAQIRNSNSPMLISLLRRLGCHVTDLGIAPDQPDQLRDSLRRGLEHDALFVTGGMSMGSHDYIPRMLDELGVRLRITKLRIKPGKPFIFGMHTDEGQANAGPPERPAGDVPGRFVFGLPGNPVSAFVCTVRFAARVLARMGGGAADERWLTGRLDAGMPVNGPREFYHPALRTISRGGDSSNSQFASIKPLAWKGSADLFTLARANVLIVRAENDPALPKGTMLRVLEI